MKKITLLLMTFIVCTSFVPTVHKNKNKSEMKITYKIGIAFRWTEAQRLERKKKLDEERAEEGKPPISDEIRKNVAETVKKAEELMDEVALLMYVNKHSSLYERAPHIKEKSIEYLVACGDFYPDGVFYKNLKEKQKVEQILLNGELFNITHSEYDWNITSETKKVGKYTCYKATAEHIGKDRKGDTLVIPIIVWFAPEIPLPFGPKGLDGLPGLVLEASYSGSKTFIYADNIDTDYTEKEIEIAKGGKSIRKQAYWELAIEAARNGKY